MADAPESGEGAEATPPTGATTETTEATEATEAPPVRQERKATPISSAALESTSIPAGVLPESEETEATETRQTEQVEETEEQIPDEVERGGQKAKNAWTQTKQEKKALKAKVKELEDQLKQRTEAPKPPEMQKLLEMQNQIEEYEKKLGQLDLTQTRNFKTRFDVPMERTLARATAILQKAGFTPDEAKSLSARMVDADASELQQLVADQPTPVQGALYNLVSEYEQLASDRTDAIANWRQTKLAIEHEDTIDQEISLAKNIEQDTTAAVKAAIDSGNWMYKITNGANPEWDEAVQARVETVKGLLRTATQADLVKYVVEGITAKPLRELLMKEKQRADKLVAEIQQRQSMRPAIRAAGSSAPERSSTPKAVSPESLINSMF